MLNLIPMGYMLKKVAAQVKVIHAERIYSISPCISENFADYINYWKHNGYWFFNQPEDIEGLVHEHDLVTEGMDISL